MQGSRPTAVSDVSPAGVFAEAARLQAEGKSFAMAVIIASKGTTPRSSARMIVLPDGSSIGTIGGGPVEAKVLVESAECLSMGESRLLHYDLDRGTRMESLQMDCGGSMSIFVECVNAARRLVVIGAGHVGLALARLGSFSGFRIAIVDERPELVTRERLPMAAELYCSQDLDSAISSLPEDPDAFVVIATHASDERALRALAGGKHAYLGMLGSQRKVAAIFGRLAAEGFTRDILESVHAPVGLDIGAETPEEIAVSVLAEIIATLKGSDARPFREKRQT